MGKRAIGFDENQHSSGDGYGSGSGYGYGDGYGSGYGDGSGSSDGSGSGDGYWATLFAMQRKKWPVVQQRLLAEAENNASAIAFWKSDCNGQASNGGRPDMPAEPGLVQEIDGPLKICTKGALHATMNPGKWKGDRLWVVALYGNVVWQDDKVGGLKRQILGEIVL